MNNTILREVLEKRKGVVVLIAILLILLNSYASIISTDNMYPSEVYICGNYPNSTQITAGEIYNKENYTLNNVVATIAANQSGLVYVSGVDVGLGSIAPLSYSSVEPSWIVGCDEGNAGSYLVYVVYSGDNFSESSLNDSSTKVFVRSAPPKIIESKPFGPINKNNISLEITTDENAYCRFSVLDTDYYSMGYEMDGNKTYHSYSLNLVDGVYSYYVRCVDHYSNVMEDSEVVEFVVDTKVPILTIISPEGVVSSKDVMLNISTDENVVCRFNKQDIGYEVMTEALSGSLLTHKTQLSLDQGVYTFYVKCKDSAGNVGKALVEFEVDLPPTASIEIDVDKERIKEGIINVKLKTSERVQPIPKLYYKFDNTDGRKEVSLEGSGKEWSGYMIVTQKSNELVGSFEFEARDIMGNVGTEITDGRLFIVDTLVPPAPKDLYVKKLTKSRISLKWYYDGEEVDHFNIYRSAEPYVNYANFLVSVSGNSYTDEVNENVSDYFYKVSAVDIAGNEGALSTEVNITINKSAKQSVVELGNGSIREIFISEYSLKKIDGVLRDAEKLNMDIDFVLSDLNGKDQLEKDTISKLGLVDVVQQSKQEVELLVGELRVMRYSDLSDNEIDNKISRIISRITQIETTTPADLVVKERSESTQIFDRTEMVSIINELPLGIYSEKQRNEYIEVNSNLISNISIGQEIRIVEVSYLDESVESKTILIEKGYEELSGYDNIVVVEYIPKAVVTSASDIEFMNGDYNIIKNDPIIRFRVSDLFGEGIWYVINSNAGLDNAKRIRTLVLFDYNMFLEGKIPEDELKDRIGITGFALLSSEKLGLSITEAIMIMLGLILIVALILYYFLFVRGVFNHKRVDEDVWKEKHELAKGEIEAMDKIKGEDTTSETITTIVGREGKTGKKGSEGKSEKLEGRKETEEDVIKKNLIEFNGLVKEVEVKIKNDDVKGAMDDYKRLQSVYSKLPKDLKIKVYKSCGEVYKKLMALRMFEEK